MKIGKSYRINYVMNCILNSCDPEFRKAQPGHVLESESFLVIEKAILPETRNLIWYKILAPSVCGWITVRVQTDKELDLSGEATIHEGGGRIFEVDLEKSSDESR